MNGHETDTSLDKGSGANFKLGTLREKVIFAGKNSIFVRKKRHFCRLKKGIGAQKNGMRVKKGMGLQKKGMALQKRGMVQRHAKYPWGNCYAYAHF